MIRRLLCALMLFAAAGCGDDPTPTAPPIESKMKAGPRVPEPPGKMKSV